MRACVYVRMYVCICMYIFCVRPGVCLCARDPLTHTHTHTFRVLGGVVRGVTSSVIATRRQRDGRA